MDGPSVGAGSPSRGRVILGLEDTAHDEATLQWAASYAGARSLPVLVVHAYQLLIVPALPGGYVSPILYEQEQREAAEAVTAHAVTALRALGVDTTGQTARDDAGDAVLGPAGPDDVVVLGTTGDGALRHALRGGTVHTALRRTTCPVIVVPARWDPRSADDRVVVGDDGSPRAQAARAWADREHGDATVHIVCIDDRPGTAGAPDGGSVIHMEAGALRPIEKLLEVAHGARLLVVGNHRSGWISSLIGRSASEDAVLDPPCPVVVVPS